MINVSGFPPDQARKEGNRPHSLTSMLFVQSDISILENIGILGRGLSKFLFFL